MVVPPKHPKMIVFSRKTLVVGYHHFRSPPYKHRFPQFGASEYSLWPLPFQGSLTVTQGVKNTHTQLLSHSATPRSSQQKATNWQCYDVACDISSMALFRFGWILNFGYGLRIVEFLVPKMFQFQLNVRETGNSNIFFIFIPIFGDSWSNFQGPHIFQMGLVQPTNQKHGNCGRSRSLHHHGAHLKGPSPQCHVYLQEIAGLIKGLLTIAFP